MGDGPTGETGGGAVNATARTGAQGVRASIGWVRRFARTTPGCLVLLAVLVAALCAAAGMVSAANLNERIAHHNHLLDRSEPATYAAQHLYAELSATDAAAASAFLSGGTQNASMRTRYQQALAGAVSALVDTTAGTTDTETRTAVGGISEQLATYTGLVEAARANNIQGFPIGSAYLREASSLMQTQILPAAEKIYAADLANVETGQRRLQSVPVSGFALSALCLAVICAGSLFLAARTNRRFNVGFVVAAASVVAVLAWMSVATQTASANVQRGRIEGTAEFDRIAKARILASKARTEETLQLIAHGDPTASENLFRDHTTDLTALLRSGPSAAARSLGQWSDSHRRQVAAYLAGDYPSAVRQAVGTAGNGSAAEYAAVESSLRDEIERTRGEGRDRLSAAGRALSWSPTGVLTLMVVAATAAVAGLWPRLKEFL